MEYLDEQVSQCDVLLALVGKKWLGVQKINCHSCGSFYLPVRLAVKDDDNSSYLRCPECGCGGVLGNGFSYEKLHGLHDEDDFVRIEITSALKRDITVVPVLVEGAKMPATEMLPPELEKFSRRQAAHVRPGRDFRRDVNDLIKALEAMRAEDTAGVCEATGVLPEVSSSLPEAPPEIIVFEGDDIAIEDPIVEKAIRKSLKKRTGELTKADLGKVTELDLQETPFTDAGFKEVAQLQQLTSLNVDYTDITDAGLKDVTKLQQLSSLSANTTVITDAGLKKLTKIPKLTLLDVGNTQITDAGLKDVAKLQKLTYLDLLRTQITDAGLKELAKLQKLKLLVLGHTQIIDADLKEVAKFKQLEWLALVYTQITDVGLKEVAKLQKLTDLGLIDTQVTDAGVAELQETLPECLFESDFD